MEEPMLPTETDVLIIGAGPTGLALATTLQQAGIRHVLIDKLAEGQNTSRAAVIHAHTLDVLDSIEVPTA
jgi:2-polyprenyl-6-methoxyphenol hydroxylase-like FAD-dependent oxidoreductase